METKFVKIKQLLAAFVKSEAERYTRARKAGKIWESWENKVKIRDNLWTVRHWRSSLFFFISVFPLRMVTGQQFYENAKYLMAYSNLE